MNKIRFKSTNFLTPYWADKLGKKEITAFQVSKRTDVLYCKVMGERAVVSGKAVLYSAADILSEF